MTETKALTPLERTFATAEGQRSIRLATDHLSKQLGRRHATALESPLSAYRAGDLTGACYSNLEYRVPLTFRSEDGLRYLVTRIDTTNTADQQTWSRWLVDVVLGECCDELVIVRVSNRTEHNDALRAARVHEATGRFPSAVHMCARPARSWNPFRRRP